MGILHFLGPFSIAKPGLSFQFVGAALGSTAWLLFMHYRITKVKRAKAGIEYPQGMLNHFELQYGQLDLLLL